MENVAHSLGLLAVLILGFVDETHVGFCLWLGIGLDWRLVAHVRTKATVVFGWDG